MDSSPGAMDLRERGHWAVAAARRRAHSPDAEKRPAGERPPAKDANWLEEDLGREAEWRERGEWICGGREGGGRVSEKLLYHGVVMRSVRSTIDS